MTILERRKLLLSQKILVKAVTIKEKNSFFQS